MYLSKKIIPLVRGAEIPSDNYFQLPEKVIQFGAGILLRGLPDYFIDKANKQQVFNGRIVIVKSTGETDAAFMLQNGLYTHCIRGMEDGKNMELNIINASISRVLHAKTNWEEILRTAGNPSLELVISNTTEVGITFVEDTIHGSPPESFPGKLLSFLHRRFIFFKG